MQFLQENTFGFKIHFIPSQKQTLNNIFSSHRAHFLKYYMLYYLGISIFFLISANIFDTGFFPFFNVVG